MPNHDGIYRHLFSHPALLRELLRDFTPLTWLGEVPIDCFHRLNGSYANEHAHQRHSDLVWRVKSGQSWLYVYVLLECQAQPDRWMALRMQVYSGLLYQDLLASRELDARHRLPPVVPVVLYHGERPWRAHRNVADLIERVPLLPAEWTPQHRYLLIEQRRLAPDVLAECKGLLAQLFRIELSDSPEVFRDRLPMLLAWLKQSDYADLKPAVELWLKERVNPEFRDALEIDWEEGTMAAKFPRKFETWYDYVKHEGKEEGKVQGKAEGMRIMLRDLADERFGTVPESVESLIDTADDPQARRLLTALLQSATPDEVLARMRRTSPG